MATEHVTVSRRLEINGRVVTYTASAPLWDDLVLDDLTEALRRQMLADALFQALPGATPSPMPKIVVFGTPTGDQ